ncbi:helix-turn-helix transcriptional regulator [Curtobacterium sp. ISL-83]|uniref:helix-turn-helix transcriptional regulator n=1 Tax=Curtobacterium sp. ISL-83 TaxID=2819145 RepID=UPI001BECBDE5|nr:helix-turn-helix transcriptional regulator [Curtobacterium sp. ISL-83]MBT2501711.1 helix-turn-helix domain-containing protein [Curtobacterium sp. ISL-83]
MDFQAELRGFLTAHRNRLSPEQAGVPHFAGSRRVPGLRREEVAYIAGISVDYYTRLEQGKSTGVSEDVLESIARALQLNDVERDHLMSLTRSIRSSRAIRRPVPPAPKVRAATQAVLDALTVPAFLQNSRLDVLAANELGWSIYPPARELGPGRYNHLRYVFLDPRAREFFRDWDFDTNNGVAVLKAALAEEPEDQTTMNLVGELSSKSARFRTLWAAHEVLRYRHGAKQYRHPLVGDLDFSFESFSVNGEPGLTMAVYVYEPNSPTAEAVQLLANWSGTSADRPQQQTSERDSEEAPSRIDRQEP